MPSVRTSQSARSVAVVKPAPAEAAKPEKGEKKDGRSPTDYRQIVYSQTRTERADPNVLIERRVIAGLKHDPRSAVFQILRTRVLMELRKKGWNSIAITSPMPGVGKSLISANLAVAIAQEVNQTVLLLDMDLRKPKVAEYFGVTPEFGLRDYLVDDVSLSKIFVNPGFERLVLLPGRGTLTNSSEMLSMPKTVQLIEEIKSRYESRIVIFDLPPLLPTDDALVCLQQVDTALLVVEDGKTTEQQIVQTLRYLEVTELMGTILNRCDSEVETYYY